MPARAQLPQPPEIAARQYILLDLTSNQVLATRDADTQADLIGLLGSAEVAVAFEALDPEDRAELLDELPASVAKGLVRTLSPQERELTAVVLGFPRGSLGRRMSPEFIHAFTDDDAAAVLDRVRARGAGAPAFM